MIESQQKAGGFFSTDEDSINFEKQRSKLSSLHILKLKFEKHNEKINEILIENAPEES